MRTTHIAVAILTFATLFDSRVVSDEGKHLGENHQKRDIPAGYFDTMAKKRPAMAAGQIA
jgi:hypothetical protein